MNILPLVSAFILIFAIGSYTFVHNLRASIQEKDHFCGTTELSLKYERRLQSDHYRQLPGKSCHPSAANSTPANFKSPRDRFHPIPESKLNIAPLLKGDNPKLEKLFLNLINSLYRFTALGNDDLAPHLLSTFKKHKSITSIDELLSKVSEEERPLFYKLLKGTQNYKLYTSEGYPPLDDFLILDTKRKKPIHFVHASRAVLNALFEERIAGQIINEEKHKWEEEQKHLPMKKDELESFLMARDCNLSDYEDLMDFIKKRDVLEKDLFEEKGIRIRHKIR